LELREQTLPAEGDWREAVRRAGILFGLTPAEVRNAGNVAKLVDQVTEKAKQLRPAVDAMSGELERKLVARGIDTASADRLTTARTAQAMLGAVIGAPSDGLVKAFATAPLRTSDTAMGQAMVKAPELGAALRDSAWTVFEALGQLADHRKTAAQAILTRLAEILAVDEHVIALKPALDEQHRKALKLLTDVVAPPPLSPPPPSSPPPTPPRAEPPVEPDDVVIEVRERSNLSAADARTLLDGLGRQMADNPKYRLNLSWKIIGKKGKGA
jgi:hypothetical protein